MSMQEDTDITFVNASTQTDFDPLYIYAKDIVENYTKIENWWKKKERCNYIIVGCTVGLITIICIRLR